MKSEKHLCQLNVAKSRTSLEDPAMADFVNGLDKINAIADAHPGFVWRLKNYGDSAQEAVSPFGNEVLANLSVWESAEALRDFVYKTPHKDYLKRKSEWFEKMDVYQVLWWAPAGHIPSLEEAKEKLDHLEKNGPTDDAFGFAEVLRPKVTRNTTSFTGQAANPA